MNLKKAGILVAVIATFSVIGLVVFPTLMANRALPSNRTKYKAEVIYNVEMTEDKKACVKDIMLQNMKKQSPKLEIYPYATLVKDITAKFEVYCDSQFGTVYEDSDSFDLWTETSTGSIHKEVRNLVGGDHCRIVVDLKCDDYCDYPCSKKTMELNVEE